MPPSIAHTGIYIDRPAQDVFNYVMDIGRTPEWRPRMSRAEWITAGSTRVGSMFQVEVEVLKYTFGFEVTITEWDPPHYVAYDAEQGLVQTHSFMEWLPDGDGCRFFIGGEPKSDSWIIKLLRPAFEYSVLTQNLADLNRLKQLMESGRDKRIE